MFVIATSFAFLSFSIYLSLSPLQIQVCATFSLVLLTLSHAPHKHHNPYKENGNSLRTELRTTNRFQCVSKCNYIHFGFVCNILHEKKCATKWNATNETRERERKKCVVQGERERETEKRFIAKNASPHNFQWQWRSEMPMSLAWVC